MPIETISPRRLYQQVADQLLALIDAGEFAVGARLPTERELAAKLGVSRPTVREALIALEVHGRVRIRVGSGIYVLPEASAVSVPVHSSAAGPFELLEARALIEGAVAEAAARQAGPSHIAALDDLLARMERSIGSGPELMALDRAFHTLVADILGNDAVTGIVGDLFDQRMNPYFAQLASYFENAVTWCAAWEEHRAVRDAIARGDSRAARKAMQTHLSNSRERFSNSFKGSTPREDANPVPRQGLPRIKRLAG